MLTQKQKNFCENYIANGFNALKAYNDAYPTKDGKSRKNKPSYPYTLLKNPEIKEYIKQRREEIYDSLNIDSMRVAQELAEIGFAEKEDTVYNTVNKIRALEILTKILGMQTQKIESQETIEVTLEE